MLELDDLQGGGSETRSSHTRLSISAPSTYETCRLIRFQSHCIQVLFRSAWGLGLKEEGIKEDYIKAIKDHLDAHPELRDNERWAGLLDRSQQHRAAHEINNENSAPYQPSSTTLSACTCYLNPPPTQVQSSLGPYQSLNPYQPTQYIQDFNTVHSMPVHNNHPPPPISQPIIHSIPFNSFYSSTCN